MRITQAEIEFYIPQRAPFIMIDNLIDVSPEKFLTDFQVLPGNIFLDNGILREFALIENIAQSSSAGLAIIKKYIGEKPVEGFMGAISKLKLYDLPRVHDTIHTIITLIAQLENIFLVKGEIYADGRKLLECEMKLAGA